LHRNFRSVAAVGLTIAGLALAAVAAVIPAAAQSSGSSTANVNLAGSLELSGLTPAFTINADANQVVTSPGAVTFTAATNNPSGLKVQVLAASNFFSGPGNISAGALATRNGSNAYQPLSTATPVNVYQSGGADSAFVSTDMQFTTPNVAPGAYSLVLNYTAIANP
jgi:hypothetical protein